jgi:hypothetical protein
MNQTHHKQIASISRIFTRCISQCRAANWVRLPFTTHSERDHLESARFLIGLQTIIHLSLPGVQIWKMWAVTRPELCPFIAPNDKQECRVTCVGGAWLAEYFINLANVLLMYCHRRQRHWNMSLINRTVLVAVVSRRKKNRPDIAVFIHLEFNNLGELRRDVGQFYGVW